MKLKRIKYKITCLREILIINRVKPIPVIKQRCKFVLRENFTSQWNMSIKALISTSKIYL